LRPLARRLLPAALAAALLLGAFAPSASAQTPPCASPWPTIALTKMADGMDDPLFVTHAGDGSGRLFVVGQGGKIYVIKAGALLPTPFLDVSDRVSSCTECGLLGLAFPADYESSGYFFISYTANTDRAPAQLPGEKSVEAGNDNVLARYRVSANPDVAVKVDVEDEETILTINQPYQNHNGGMIAFGPDGALYMAVGDGGQGGDPQNRAQDINSPLGKMLRIEVGATGTYTVPPDNPFAGPVAGKDEIWSYGLRNPWRFSFDRLTGDKWIGDVGQGAWEEINFEPAATPGGRNYGWRILEGTHCYPPDKTTCDRTGLTLPVWEYGRTEGGSITGGYVYRGTANPAMSGIYFYGDYSSGTIWGLRRIAGGWENRQVQSTSFSLASFGEDEDGELYVANLRGGAIHRMDAGPAEPAFCAFLPGVSRPPGDQ
jgi:glucose/arabinose dehydrogenase